jgi:flagellar biogenesis protein FliO
MQAVGDGWKMVAYLVPTLVFVLVCLNLLRRYQEKTGRLPGAIRPAARTAAPPKQTVAAALAALFANKGGGRAGPAATEIRLLETLNIGTAALHLVEVRGKTLLLGVTPGGVSLLKDFTEHEGADSTDFRQILKSAAADLDELDLPNSKLPVNAVVDSLEDAMRDTADAMERRLRRLRKAQETEGGGL